MTTLATDIRFMAAAIRLSRSHEGRTSTNPSVATLIVRDDGAGPVIVGRGVTAIGGRPHAEPQALDEAGALARGATAYVTLEPCAHHGRTPPCANALVTGWRGPRRRCGQRPRPARIGQGLRDPARRRHRGGRERARRRGGRWDGGLPHSIVEEAGGSDSETGAFARRHDRPQGRRPGRHHRRDRSPPGAIDAGALRRHPGRHRHRTCRRSAAHRASARAGGALAGPRRARPPGPAAAVVQAGRNRA